MSTIRVEKNKDNPYVVINKIGLNDENLSWKAKGILGYLLSKPDDWKCQIKDLIKHSKDKRDATYSGLRELRENGYMIKRPIKDNKGKIIEWEEIIYEVPNEEAKQIYIEQSLKLKRKKKSTKDSSTSNSVSNDIELHSLQQLWESVKEILKTAFAEITFNTWINPLEASELIDNILVIRAPNDFTKGYVDQHYIDILLKSAKAVLPKVANINIII